MSKPLTYMERVQDFKKKNPSVTHKEAMEFVSAQIKEEKNKAASTGKLGRNDFGLSDRVKAKMEIAPCIRCGYEIEDPGTAFVCAACGIQN